MPPDERLSADPLAGTLREELLYVARDAVRRSASQQQRLAPSIMSVDASIYASQHQWELEKRLVFRRLPLVLAASAELPSAGDYVTVDVAGVPVLLIRGRDGTARAFLNACSHRAARVCEGRGNAPRLVCPFHGWSFGLDGALVGVAMAGDFGSLDKSCHGLTPLPILESAGLIWVILDPASQLDIRAFLGGYDRLLDLLGLNDYHFVQRKVLHGSNWKLANDPYFEFYHVPVLHRDSFGSGVSNKALYYFWGPHQRMISQLAPTASGQAARDGGRRLESRPAERNLFKIAHLPEGEWGTDAMLLGQWLVFPNFAINRFFNGGDGVMLSQVFPSDDPATSITVQTYMMANEPDAAQRETAESLCGFLAHVVEDEDLATAGGQQAAIASGLVPRLQFGRNEWGCQHFHHWLDLALAMPQAEFDSLFVDGIRGWTRFAD